MLKLLLTLGVIAAVWYAFKSRKRVTKQNFSRFRQALDEARKAMQDSAAARQTKTPPANDDAPESTRTAVPVEMRPCPRCGAYVAVGAECACTKA